MILVGNFRFYLNLETINGLSLEIYDTN